jgi:magnesium transporter
VFTILTALSLPLSVGSGVYGMNFAEMPELLTEWGYQWFWGVQALLFVNTVYWLQRNGMFVSNANLH